MTRVLARGLWIAGLPFRWLALVLIATYRGTVGRVAGGRCRFYPSCSAYAAEAIRTHGAAKGAALSLWRILRCSPLTAGGPDPVPRRAERAPV